MPNTGMKIAIPDASTKPPRTIPKSGLYLISYVLIVRTQDAGWIASKISRETDENDFSTRSNGYALAYSVPPVQKLALAGETIMLCNEGDEINVMTKTSSSITACTVVGGPPSGETSYIELTMLRPFPSERTVPGGSQIPGLLKWD